MLSVADYEDTLLLKLRTHALVWPNKDSMIAGTNTGLYKIHAASGHFKRILPQLHNVRVVDLCLAGADTLLVATGMHGLYAYKGAQLLHHLHEGNGLQDNRINKITLQADGIWVMSKRGVQRLAMAALCGNADTLSANVTQTLPLSEAYDMARIHDQLYIATAAGLVTLPMHEFNRKPAPPRLSMATMRVNGQPLNAPELLLPDANTSVRLQFPAISFGNGPVAYRYSLEKSEPRWQHTQHPQVAMQHQRPGRYRFVVQARTELSEWCAPVELVIEIPPFWWQSPWFLTLVIGLCLAMVYALFRLKLVLIDGKRLQHYVHVLHQKFQGSNYLLLKEGSTTVRVAVPHILWIKSDGNYCHIQCRNKHYYVLLPLKELEAMLAPWPHFARVHRSHLVNLHFVDSASRTALTIEDVSIPIGKTYQKEIRQRVMAN